MNALRRHSLFLLALLVALVAGAEIWVLGQARQRARRALSALEGVRQERDYLVRLSPAPSRENEARLVREIATWRSRLEECRGAFQKRESDHPPGPTPERATDAFFALATWVEQTRALAGEARIALRSDEQFGFSSHARAGPAEPWIEAVLRQRRAVERVLGPLFEARPLALLGVRREPPGMVPALGEDFFVLDPGLSVKQDGLVETEALRVEFTGQTAVVRDFLNGLIVLPHSAVVRSVEVAPLPADGSERTTSGVEASIPVVRASYSKFSVTVEFVRLPENLGGPAS